MKTVNIPKKKEPRATDKGSGGVATLMANERAFRFIVHSPSKSSNLFRVFAISNQS
jgi:hypothetical protein